MRDGSLYEDVGVSAGTARIGDQEQEVVGIIFPPLSDGETWEEQNEVEVHLTLPAAKALLIDLRDMIEACEKHLRGEDPGE